MERYIGIDTHRDSSRICVPSTTGSEAVPPPSRPIPHFSLPNSHCAIASLRQCSLPTSHFPLPTAHCPLHHCVIAPLRLLPADHPDGPLLPLRA